MPNTLLELTEAAFKEIKYKLEAHGHKTERTHIENGINMGGIIIVLERPPLKRAPLSAEAKKRLADKLMILESSDTAEDVARKIAEKDLDETITSGPIN